MVETILSGHFSSVFRRKWRWQFYGEPHFTDHTYTFWRLYKAEIGEGVYSLARGFYAAEAIIRGGHVLDIGCGDGGYTKRFLAPKAGHVDAVDLEPSAIATAQKRNAAPNISYMMLDAANDPLPRSEYDNVVMDGVLGHATRQDGEKILARIAAALSANGVFSGSETLGHEGHDHLQFFETEDQLRDLLKRFFSSVLLRVAEYNVGSSNRVEAYWNCKA